jgi:hypothetical protein
MNEGSGASVSDPEHWFCKEVTVEVRNDSRVVGKPECAGINRHVVGDARALQERRTATPSWPRVLQEAA